MVVPAIPDLVVADLWVEAVVVDEEVAADEVVAAADAAAAAGEEAEEVDGAAVRDNEQ